MEASKREDGASIGANLIASAKEKIQSALHAARRDERKQDGADRLDVEMELPDA